MDMEMKEILNRMLNHEELTREETKNILVSIFVISKQNMLMEKLLTRKLSLKRDF